MGVVQGLAEFLPISSSGHLSIFQNLLGIDNALSGNLFFNVMLHVGTLGSVIVAFWDDIQSMIIEFLRMIGDLFGRKKRNVDAPVNAPARRLILLIIVATLPLVIVLPFKDAIESLSSNTIFVGCMLIITGIMLFLADRMKSGKATERSAKFTSVLFVGLMQALATIPGISRSGATISSGLSTGFERKFAFRFAFLMSLPAVAGAALLEAVDAVQAGIDTSTLLLCLVGMIVSFFTGLAAIKLLRKVTAKGSFGWFSGYCLAVGVIAIVLSIVL